MSKLRTLKKGDYLIIIFVIMFTIIITLMTFKNEILGNTRIITITVNGESSYYRYGYLDKDLIEFEFGDEIGYLLYDRGKIKLKPMYLDSCPKRICSTIGWISRVSEAIVCLPNKIIITIIGPKTNPVDIISF